MKISPIKADFECFRITKAQSAWQSVVIMWQIIFRLMYLKNGLIEQIGSDLEYQFGNYEKKEISREEQIDKLKNIKQIRNSGNKNMLMHRVVFKPSKKYIDNYNNLNSGHLIK